MGLRILVAPHAGAWIETAGCCRPAPAPAVAPHASAWIETKECTWAFYSPRKSHPTRVRGLKQVPPLRGLHHPAGVAPHAGAWIETHWPLPKSKGRESHPTRVRGLKHSVGRIAVFDGHVAPHAGAWIETYEKTRPGGWHRVAPHAGAWIETDLIQSQQNSSAGRTPRGCVD